MASTTPSKSGPASFVTPTKRAGLVGATNEAGPSRVRPQAASPAYSSRKHSLYGIEDRVVIDPGSRIWKVGFSGESSPRSVFWASEDGEAWGLDLQATNGARGNREEGRRIVEGNVLKKSRETFIKHLMTDSKSRKVIVLENTFLPIHVKEAIAQALFNNLRVPSIAFTSSNVLALASCGRITGLVVDCGWLETTLTPVSYSRPLVHLARSTPLAGRSLHYRLRALLHHHSVYVPPPPKSPGGSANRPERPVPLRYLTDQVIQQILTKGCIAGGLPGPLHPKIDRMEIDPPPMALEDINESALMSDLRDRYSSSSTLPDRMFRIPHSTSTRDGQGRLVVPGWVLERAAEILFDPDVTGDEADTVPEAILTTLLKLPVDLRPAMSAAILVVGGTASLPNFIPRLRLSLLQKLLPPPSSPSPAEGISISAWKSRHTEPYRELYPLSSKLAILNDPRALESEGTSRGGSAPRWTPSLISWVGGSLAGALKTGGQEMLREEYDTLTAEGLIRGEQYRRDMEDNESEAQVAAVVGISLEELRPGMALLGQGRKKGWRDGVTMGDWTRLGPLKV